MTTTLRDLARQANVEFVTGRTYFTKEHRNCHAMEKYNVALQAHLDQDVKDHQEYLATIAKLEREKSTLAKYNSDLAAKLSEAIEGKANAEKTTIRRGLEATDLGETVRNRIMDVSGSTNGN